MKVDLRFRSRLLDEDRGDDVNKRQVVWIALLLMMLAVLVGAAATTVLAAYTAS